MNIEKNWHLDKRLTVANIITILGVVAVGLSAWFSLVNQGTAQSKDIKLNSEKTTEQQVKIDGNTTNIWKVSEDVAVVKDNIQTIKENQRTINNKLDTLILRGSRDR